MDCVFCKIIAGEIPSAKVFEDNDTLAFLDASPDTKGHCLVVSKKHFETIFDIDEEILKKVMVTLKAVALKIKDSLGAQGMHIANNNGILGGQIVSHFHIHIIPRYENDGLVMYGPRPKKDKNISLKELEKIAEKIGKII